MALNIALVIGILGYFGLETTTFAALLAAAGVAIGMAWSGLLAKIPNVVPEPAPDVEMLTFALAGPVLVVRPYCHTDHYWQVYFGSNRLIREFLGEAGFAVPEQHFAVKTRA